MSADVAAKVRVLYWKEVPVQVQAEDGNGKVSVMLDHRFQEGADAIAMFDGSYGADEYLDGWEWAEPPESAGPEEPKQPGEPKPKGAVTAQAAAEVLAERYNNGMPQDFVARIRDLHKQGKRDPTPGAIDGWIQ